MNHFHNIPGMAPKEAIAVSQQDVWLYWVKESAALFFLLWVTRDGLGVL